MNAPKKIWVWDYAADQMVNENPDSTDVQYIRADLVDELVVALELSAFHMHKITTARGKADYSVVRAALAALKEEE